MLRGKAAEVHRDSFAPSHLSTSVASRSGWLAQLVRAPVSHTGGHRFESCTAHYTRFPLPPPPPPLKAPTPPPPPRFAVVLHPLMGRLTPPRSFSPATVSPLFLFPRTRRRRG